MSIGFVLMIFGLLVYLGNVAFTFSAEDIDELRFATAMGLVSMVSFMLGAILETRDLRSFHKVDEYYFGKPKNKRKQDEYEPLPTEKFVALLIAFLTVIFGILALAWYYSG